jgi:tRNA (adenine22-N1)-methyltransferase
MTIESQPVGALSAETGAAPKLTPRLAKIAQLLLAHQPQQRYHSVWDCCCDHGYLGFHLLASGLFQQSYFVDQIRHITDQVSQVLQRHGGDRYQVLTMDVADLLLDRDVKHCVIIAGVGGRAIIEMLAAMRSNNADLELDFILCATNYVYEMRDYLAQQSVQIIEQHIVEDRGRQYECLYLRSLGGGAHQYSAAEGGANDRSRSSRIGDMWRLDDPVHQRYQAKLLKHYRQQLRSQDSAYLRQVVLDYQHCFDDAASDTGG